MKLSGTLFWSVLFGGLILLNVYSFHQKNSLAAEAATALISLENRVHTLESVKEEMASRMMMQLRSEGSPINGDLVLTAGAEDDVQHTLRDLLSSRDDTYVFYVPQINCRTCGEEQGMEFVNELAGMVDPGRVLILARYSDRRDLQLFKRLNRIEQKVYNKGDGTLGLAAEQKNRPFMFLLRPDLTAHYLFIPDPDLPELTRQYHDWIREKIASE